MTAQDLETRMAAGSNAAAEALERRIAGRLAAAGCRLRHDKVVLRLITDVRVEITEEVSPAECIIFTVTAPIKHPAKTIALLTHLLPQIPAEALHTTVHGNKVHARRVGRASTDMPGVMGFVHDPEHEAGFILDLVESTLNGD